MKNSLEDVLSVPGLWDIIAEYAGNMKSVSLVIRAGPELSREYSRKVVMRVSKDDGVVMQPFKRVHHATIRSMGVVPLEVIPDSVTHLSLSMSRVSDLSPLSRFTELTHLNISNTWVTDLSPLRELTKLTHLYVSNTPLCDISPLNEMTQITHLHMDNTKVRDVTPLSGMINLVCLSMHRVGINRDTLQIGNLKQLTMVDLLGTGIGPHDVISLCNCPDLRVTCHARSDIQSMVANFPKVRKLYVGSNTCHVLSADVGDRRIIKI